MHHITQKNFRVVAQSLKKQHQLRCLNPVMIVVKVQMIKGKRYT